ncbi:hypothetical protein IWQ60_004973 [Tieghemiomyces parasiticus]|uniref:DH domain-containing protein n=1 Tax=Tieghemiomyces parasiticus TaxID=78921 RepID=A0A9W8DYV3_9FUNG|nr:hypothetical protein IWQ60_004973 [Tieghemiomyces parasiticus]
MDTLSTTLSHMAGSPAAASGESHYLRRPSSSDSERWSDDRTPSVAAGSLPTTARNSVVDQPEGRYLDLSGRPLTHLPLPNGPCEGLNISYTSLTRLPQTLCRDYYGLRRLILNHNHLDELPFEVGFLYNLRELHLSHNRLTRFPEAVGRLAQLEVLDLSFNQLSQLDFAITQLGSLRYLDISFNQLVTLPSYIGLLSGHLQTLLVQGNPFTKLATELFQPLLQYDTPNAGPPEPRNADVRALTQGTVPLSSSVPTRGAIGVPPSNSLPALTAAVSPAGEQLGQPTLGSAIRIHPMSKSAVSLADSERTAHSTAMGAYLHGEQGSAKATSGETERFPKLKGTAITRGAARLMSKLTKRRTSRGAEESDIAANVTTEPLPTHPIGTGALNIRTFRPPAPEPGSTPTNLASSMHDLRTFPPVLPVTGPTSSRSRTLSRQISTPTLSQAYHASGEIPLSHAVAWQARSQAVSPVVPASAVTSPAPTYASYPDLPLPTYIRHGHAALAASPSVQPSPVLRSATDLSGAELASPGPSPSTPQPPAMLASKSLPGSPRLQRVAPAILPKSAHTSPLVSRPQQIPFTAAKDIQCSSGANDHEPYASPPDSPTDTESPRSAITPPQAAAGELSSLSTRAVVTPPTYQSPSGTALCLQIDPTEIAGAIPTSRSRSRHASQASVSSLFSTTSRDTTATASEPSFYSSEAASGGSEADHSRSPLAMAKYHRPMEAMPPVPPLNISVKPSPSEPTPAQLAAHHTALAVRVPAGVPVTYHPSTAPVMPELPQLLDRLRDEWDLDPHTAEKAALAAKIKHSDLAKQKEAGAHVMLRRVSVDPLNTLSQAHRVAHISNGAPSMDTSRPHAIYLLEDSPALRAKRQCILREILDTERTYVDCLVRLIKVYVCPLDPTIGKACGIAPTTTTPATSAHANNSSSDLDRTSPVLTGSAPGPGDDSYFNLVPGHAEPTGYPDDEEDDGTAYGGTALRGSTGSPKVSDDTLAELNSGTLPTPGGAPFKGFGLSGLQTPFSTNSFVKSLRGGQATAATDAASYATKYQTVLTPAEIKTIFGNVDSILLFHRDHILPELEATIQAAAGTDIEARVGGVFLRNAAFIRIYSVYVNNFDHATRLLTDLEKSRKKFAKFLALAKRQPDHNQLNLLGYLLLPVQRVPRYKLLLEQLLACTPVTHPDHNELQRALAEIQVRADEINEKKREQERNIKIIQIAHHIRGSSAIHLIQPHRRFIRRGMLYLESQVTPTRNVRKHPLGIKSHHIGMVFHFYLFNDIMLQCTKSTSPGPSGAPITPYSPATSEMASATSNSTANHGHGVIGSQLSSSHQQHLINVLRLDTKVAPASIMPDRTTLRLVDSTGIYYLQGNPDELERWVYVINNRFQL